MAAQAQKAAEVEAKLKAKADEFISALVRSKTTTKATAKTEESMAKIKKFAEKLSGYTKTKEVLENSPMRKAIRMCRQTCDGQTDQSGEVRPAQNYRQL